MAIALLVGVSLHVTGCYDCVYIGFTACDSWNWHHCHAYALRFDQAWRVDQRSVAKAHRHYTVVREAYYTAVTPPYHVPKCPTCNRYTSYLTCGHPLEHSSLATIHTYITLFKRYTSTVYASCDTHGETPGTICSPGRARFTTFKTVLRLKPTVSMPNHMRKACSFQACTLQACPTSTPLTAGIYACPVFVKRCSFENHANLG